MLQTSLISRRPVGPLERETRMAMNALQDLKTIRRMAAEEHSMKNKHGARRTGSNGVRIAKLYT